MQNQMMKKMQQMQQKLKESMAQMQQDLEKEQVEGSAGQGRVKVVVNGHQEIQSIKIAPEVVDPEELEMLEDLIVTAVREAIDKSKEVSSSKMSGLTAGLPIPPGFL